MPRIQSRKFARVWKMRVQFKEQNLLLHLKRFIPISRGGVKHGMHGSVFIDAAISGCSWREEEYRD